VVAHLDRGILRPVALPLGSVSFILLNLAFSTRRAYAAPLILLAQTPNGPRPIGGR